MFRSAEGAEKYRDTVLATDATITADEILLWRCVNGCGWDVCIPTSHLGVGMVPGHFCVKCGTHSEAEEEEDLPDV